MIARPALFIADKNKSSWSLRPWVLMKHAGLDFTEHLLPIYDDPKVLRQVPNGKVPYLEHGVVRVWESLAIVEYVAETWPDCQLWPLDPASKAWARSLSSEMHAGFTALRSQCSFALRARTPTTVISDELRADLNRLNTMWNECLDTFGGPFLFGSRFTVADAMYAPVVFRFRTYSLPAVGRAADYVQHMLSLPAMKAWET